MAGRKRNSCGLNKDVSVSEVWAQTPFVAVLKSIKWNTKNIESVRSARRLPLGASRLSNEQHCAMEQVDSPRDIGI